MTMETWAIITSEDWSAVIGAARAAGAPVTAVVLGDRSLADAVATGGADAVHWVDVPADAPVEAYGPALAAVARESAPAVVLSGPEPASRALLGAVATACGAALVPGAVGISADGVRAVVRRSLAAGETIEELAVHGAVAAIVTGDDVEPVATAAEVVTLDLAPAGMTISGTEDLGVASGLDDAERVVSFGRGVKQKDDVALVESLAAALGAEIACSMPIADDLGWLEKSRYVGRSGQHISPALYLALGIAGAPQHLEGVRGARVVAAINNDPEARIFSSVDYGIVGDLYEVVPALMSEISK